MNARRPASRDRAADDVDAIIGQWRSQRPDLDCSTIGVFGNNINNVHYLLAYSTPGFGKNVLYNEPRTFGIRAGVKW